MTVPAITDAEPPPIQDDPAVEAEGSTEDPKEHQETETEDPAAETSDQETPESPDDTQTTEEEAEEAISELSKEDTALLQKLVTESYGGDVKKFIGDLTAAKNQTSNLAQRFDSVEAMLSEVVNNMRGLQAETRDPESAPEVVELDETIQSHTLELDRLAKTQNDNFIKLSSLNDQIAELNGELKRAPEDEHQLLISKKDRLEGQKERILEKLSGLQERTENIGKALKKSEKERDKTVTKIEKQWEDEDKAKEAEEANNRRTVETFTRFVDTEATKLNFDKAERDAAYEWVRKEFISHCATLDPGTPINDSYLQEFTKHRMTAYNNYLQQRAGARRATPKKQTAASPRKSDSVPKTPTPKPSSVDRSKPQTYAEVHKIAEAARANARKVFGD